MTTPTPSEPAAPAADPATQAAPAATPPAGEGDSQAQGSLLAPEAPAAPTGDDWLPEKFRVTGEDGKVDEAASARKLAESYRALEAHKGALPVVPATPEDYKLEAPKDAEGNPVEGVDMEAFTGDPLFKGFAERAHGKGLTNEQLQFVTEEYLTLAPQLFAADASLSVEEAKAELGKLWPDEAMLNANLGSVVKAINGFGAEADEMPGSRSRLMEKYGRDPDFIAFAASVAAEMKEDRVPVGDGSSGPSQLDIESKMRSDAYLNPKHPDHQRVKAEVKLWHDKKFGTEKRR